MNDFDEGLVMGDEDEARRRAEDWAKELAEEEAVTGVCGATTYRGRPCAREATEPGSRCVFHSSRHKRCWGGCGAWGAFGEQTKFRCVGCWVKVATDVEIAETLGNGSWRGR